MKQIPAPIQRTIFKMALLGVAIAVFGIIWSFASHDLVLLLLSLSVGALCFGRALFLFHTASAGQYEVLEGLILSDRVVPLRSRHQIMLEEFEQKPRTLIVAGKDTLCPGTMYRIYLAGGQDSESLEMLPEHLRPARAMLGHEILDRDEVLQ